MGKWNLALLGGFLLAVFRHEHAHIFGYDGQRVFTDALTEPLETVIRQRNVLDRYEQEQRDQPVAAPRKRRKRRVAPAPSRTCSPRAC